MNAPAGSFAPTVRTADPGEPAVEAFVRARPEATPFHLPQWSRAIASGTGQRAHLLVVERGGEIHGLLPLTELRSRLFGAALVSTGFGVDGGILAGDDVAVAALAGAAVDLAAARGCPSVELRGGKHPDGWRKAEGAYAGFVRELPADEEAVLNTIPRKQRAEVRRALTFGLDIAMGDAEAHYRAYAESVRNLGTPVFPRALFTSVLREYGADADILTVSRDGKPLASVLSLYLNGTVYPYWGGGTHAARAARANELMYYALMRHAVRRGCTRFDFGRSKLGTGAFAFKKNWGFEPKPLVYAHWGEAREVNPLSPKYRLKIAAWRKLPLWLANRLGPPIARGLG
ncbi:MAG TPA: FemAB family XrtA/PEP-CTERM system-associated protein [Allosphingosinicella sp.]|nr:FemAB family XrtA/PEP-CTERM system-associated protein [Allosphingosinicella sp.]